MNKLALVVLVLVVTLVTSSETEDAHDFYKYHSLIKKYGNSLDEFSEIVTQNSTEAKVRKYWEYRKQIMAKDQSYRFTRDVPTLTPDEEIVNAYLETLRNEVIHIDDSPLLLEFFEGQKIIKDTELHEFFKKMPKGGQMHIHLEGAVALDTFISFTYSDYVYFNVEKQEFKTVPKGLDEKGFLRCNELRQIWGSNTTFDNYLRKILVLQPEDISSKQDHLIWTPFEGKFILNDPVIHYYEFYKLGLLDYCRQSIRDGIYIVEIRHASGRIFDENNKILSLKDEFELYRSALEEIKQEYPDFQLAIIVASLKSKGEEHVREQLKSYLYAMDHGYEFVTGFDLVNEEDFVLPITTFIEDIIKAKEGYPDFKFYIHSGESNLRSNENLYDAILLGTKRIGHGFNLALRPHLIDLVVERDIGYEICPISNYIMAYTLDMRWHPAKCFIAEGVPVTVNSDCPTFWNYEGVALDFTYAFLAWELDLKDIKQFAINAVTHSSIKDELKPAMLEKFHRDWNKFIASVVESHGDLSKLS
ncbi:unnamed protein product [Moneuplotes crassus]|uniref:Adenosine deaminase domain-containing protein n=1 Tax=Euplotes crassus TaxID=5936 RepID=A0AAD1UA34_EUPCR|nr:unnamed protein product [Moneuplotes crassus]